MRRLPETGDSSENLRSRRNALVLRVAGLRVWRGAESILEGIDWTVAPGEHWAILGANGSGKTSLLSALTGYLTPSGGSIELLGNHYGSADWRELRRRIGWVSSSLQQRMPNDEPALETVVSGKFAMIDYWGRVQRADREQALWLLEQVEGRYLADRAWGFLSQGERQRVLIGRALMARPRVLILDEPCAGLDPVARENFLQFLQRLGHRRDSPALVLVTHHVEEIVPVFTHTLILKAGKVLVSGLKQKVLTARWLTAAFGATVKLKRSDGRYGLSVSAKRRRVV